MNLRAFIGAALVGLAYCDYQCTYLGFKRCYKTLGSSFFGAEGKDFCSNHEALDLCFANEAAKCGNIENWYVKETQDAMDKICNPESEFHEYFLTHKDCLLHVLEDAGDHCSNTSAAIMGRILVETDREIKIALLKELCRQYEIMHECYYTTVSDSCGKNAEMLARLAHESDHKVTFKICEDTYGVKRVRSYAGRHSTVEAPDSTTAGTSTTAARPVVKVAKSHLSLSLSTSGQPTPQPLVVLSVMIPALCIYRFL